MQSLLVLLFLASCIVAAPPKQNTFPCVVMNNYTPHEIVECDTQCYSIKVLTHVKGKETFRTIRRGCDGKEDLIERARFEFEHSIVLQKTACRNVGSGTLRQDGDMTLTQQCCSGAFCNSAPSSLFLIPLIVGLLAFLAQ